MALHRRITFAKGTVGRYVKKHGLTMTYLQVPAAMICRVQSHPGEKHFILTFRKPDGRLMRIPYSQGSGVKDYPEIFGVLEGLASDILLYHDNPTARAYCEEFEIAEEDCEEGFKLLEAVALRTLEFLGSEAYNELTEMSIEGRFEMEGARRWQRSSICGL